MIFRYIFLMFSLIVVSHGIVAEPQAKFIEALDQKDFAEAKKIAEASPEVINSSLKLYARNADIETCKFLLDLEESHPVTPTQWGNIIRNAILSENVDTVKLFLDHSVRKEKALGSAVTSLVDFAIAEGNTELLSYVLKIPDGVKLSWLEKTLIFLLNNNQDELANEILERALSQNPGEERGIFLGLIHHAVNDGNSKELTKIFSILDRYKIAPTIVLDHSYLSSYLRQAISKGNFDVFALLLKSLKGESVISALSSSEQAVLLNTLVSSKPEWIFSAIDAGYDPNTDDVLFGTPLAVAIAEKAELSVVAKFLDDYGPTLEVLRPDSKFPSVQYLITRHKFEQAELFLNAGANPNIVDASTNPPLYDAMVDHNNKLIDLLLSKNVDVNTPGAGGITPLMGFASTGSLPYVKRLIDLGAKVNARTSQQKTALTFAITGGHKDVVEYLTEKNAQQ